MKLCLCNTNSLECKGFINGEEYNYETNFINGSKCVYYNDCGDWKWFDYAEFEKYFKAY